MVSEEDKANSSTLSNLFSSVFTCEDATNLPSLDVVSKLKGNTVTDVRVTTDAVKEKLNKLDIGKVQGPDKIPAKVLKELST